MADRFEGIGLECRRGGRTVFRRLDFTITGGGALLLVGPNGSGKSSLLRLMAGLLAPAAGKFLWNAADLDEDPESHRARLRYVGHAEALKPALTAAENLQFWADLMGGGARKPDIPAALSSMGLNHLKDQPARFLSAGQKRRVNLARLALAPAALWLLDEPATALDAETVDRLRGMIAEHRGRGGMAVVSTHGDLRLPGAETLDLGAAHLAATAADISDTATDTAA